MGETRSELPPGSFPCPGTRGLWAASEQGWPGFSLSLPMTFSSLYPKGQLQERQLATGLKPLCASTSTDTARRGAAAPARAGAMHRGVPLPKGWRWPGARRTCTTLPDSSQTHTVTSTFFCVFLFPLSNSPCTSVR